MILLLVPVFVVAGVVVWIKALINLIFRTKRNPVGPTADLRHLDPELQAAFVRMRAERVKAGMRVV